MVKSPRPIKSLLAGASNKLKLGSGAQSKPIVVYCSILGGYDDLPTFSHTDPEIVKVCFTDTPEMFASTQGWKIVPVESAFLDPKLMNGYLKSNSHRLFGHNTTAIWVDGNLKDLHLTSALVDEVLTHGPAATPAHVHRYRVRDEIEAVLAEGLESQASADRIAALLATDGFPDERPLSATMMVVRDNSDEALRNANELWQQLICSGIRRDQLTFDYALWSQGIKAARIDVDWRVPNRIFNRVPHRNETVRPAPKASRKSAPNELHMPNLPSDYPTGVQWVFETQSAGEADVQRQLNEVVATTAPGGKVEGNYCHMNGAVLKRETPADPRRSWKRQYLRGAVKGSKRALEIGFNAGHSAVLMLEAEPKLKLTSIDIAIHDYVRPCGEVLKKAYRKRFDLVADDSLNAIREIDLSKFDFVHIDGGHGAEVFIPELDWFCANATSGTRMVVDDCYVSYIRAAIDRKIELGLIKSEKNELPTSGENELFVRS